MDKTTGSASVNSIEVGEVLKPAPSTSGLNGSVIYIKQEKNDEELTCLDVLVKQELSEDESASNCGELTQVKEEEEMIITGDDTAVLIKQELFEDESQSCGKVFHNKEEKEVIIAGVGEESQPKDEEELITPIDNMQNLHENLQNLFDSTKYTPREAVHMVRHKGKGVYRGSKNIRHPALFYNEVLTLRQPYRCPHCNFNTSSKIKLKIHVISHSTKWMRYRCNYCDYKTADPTDSNNHASFNHKAVKNHKCPLCSYKSSIAVDLKLHIMARHSGEKPYRCFNCYYRTLSRTSVKRHVLVTHHTE